MREANIRALKRQIQAAAVEAARKFRDIELQETDHHRCGECEPCRESLSNLAQLFFNALMREVSALAVSDSLQTAETFGPSDFMTNKDRLN